MKAQSMELAVTTRASAGIGQLHYSRFQVNVKRQYAKRESKTLKKILALFCLLMAVTVEAQTQQGRLTPLISRSLPDIPGKEGVDDHC